MQVAADMIFAGARFSEASADFPASWFVTVIDDEGNVFENLYAKEAVIPEGGFPPGTPVEARVVIGKNRDGKLRMQVTSLKPA